MLIWQIWCIFKSNCSKITIFSISERHLFEKNDDVLEISVRGRHGLGGHGYGKYDWGHYDSGDGEPNPGMTPTTLTTTTTWGSIPTTRQTIPVTTKQASKTVKTTKRFAFTLRPTTSAKITPPYTSRLRISTTSPTPQRLYKHSTSRPYIKSSLLPTSKIATVKTSLKTRNSPLLSSTQSTNLPPEIPFTEHPPARLVFFFTTAGKYIYI